MDSESTEAPLVEFRLNEDSMCLVASINSISPEREDLWYLSEGVKLCDGEGRRLWKGVYTIQEESLYKYNDY